MSSADSNAALSRLACLLWDAWAERSKQALLLLHGSMNKANTAGRLSFDAGPHIGAWQHGQSKHSRQAAFDTGHFIVAWQHEGSKCSVQPWSLTGADLQQYWRCLGLHCTHAGFPCTVESQ